MARTNVYTAERDGKTIHVMEVLLGKKSYNTLDRMLGDKPFDSEFAEEAMDILGKDFHECFENFGDIDLDLWETFDDGVDVLHRTTWEVTPDNLMTDDEDDLMTDDEDDFMTDDDDNLMWGPITCGVTTTAASIEDALEMFDFEWPSKIRSITDKVVLDFSALTSNEDAMAEVAESNAEAYEHFMRGDLYEIVFKLVE